MRVDVILQLAFNKKVLLRFYPFFSKKGMNDAAKKDKYQVEGSDRNPLKLMTMI